VAAIRASQLKMKVAVIEKAEVGGICLNWGCIPTKSLLKSAQVFEYLNHASDYGISVGGEVKADFGAVIARSRNVAEGWQQEAVHREEYYTCHRSTLKGSSGSEAGWEENNRLQGSNDLA